MKARFSMRVIVEEHKFYLSEQDAPEVELKEVSEFITGWDKKFSPQFTSNMHKRVCANYKNVYVVMREVCPILDMMLVEERYDRYLTAEVRDKLAHILRLIDGEEA